MTTHQIFATHLQALQTMHAKAMKTKNPIASLQKQGARTSLFYLEALCRMYKTFTNKKRFTKLLETVKLLEDNLGALDFFDEMLEACKAKKASKEKLEHWQLEISNQSDAMNSLLQTEDFLNAKWFEKQFDKLNTAKWLVPEEEANAIIGYYQVQATKINEWYAGLDRNLTNLEEHVHELRRKIRWLSIIPQAMVGGIQLQDPHKPMARFAKYATKQVITSPFNKMPKPSKDHTIIYLLNKQAFYALSFTIYELGLLKDKGLQTIATATDSKTENNLEATLAAANKLAKQFFTDKVLEGLVKY